MNPIHKATVLKAVREHGKWTGYIAPSNVNSFHINGGWHIGHAVKIEKVDQQYYVVREDDSMELGEYLSNFKYYNCCGELGQRVRFWQDKPSLDISDIADALGVEYDAREAVTA